MSGTKHFGIFDILGTQSFFYFSSVGKEYVRLEREIPLHPVLISPEDINSNKADYIVSKNDFCIEDLILNDAHGKTYLSSKNVYPLEYLLLGLENKIYPTGEDRYTLQHSLFSMPIDNPDACYIKLSNWFRSQKALLASCNPGEAIDSTNKDVDQMIITISDDASFEYQEKILAAMNEKRKCTLLWRSVAAALGAEEYFKEFNLQEGDIITVYDRTTVDVRIVNLELQNCNGKLIPGHRLYRTSDSAEPIKEWYPNEKRFSSYDRLPFLPYTIDKDGFLEYKEKPSGTKFSIDISKCDNSKLIIAVGPGLIFPDDPRIVSDPDGKLINIGAGRFANRMSNKITSYYDECESFSMVVQKKDEEDVILTDLIKATTKLTGGLVIKEDPIYDLSFDVMNPKLDFYLRLGVKSDKLPLKMLSQKLELDADDEDIPNKIPLCLQPTLIAGQGRAKVYVKAARKEDSKLFQPVELNWSLMEDAKESDGTNTTVEKIRARIPRSYPVNVPAPKADKWRLHTAVRDMKAYLDGYKILDSIELNKPEYPYKQENSIEKFQKINIMGVNWETECLPYDKPIIERFCQEMNSLAYDDYYSLTALRHIGWTYNRSGVYDALLEHIVREVEHAGKTAGPLAVQKSTICANIINDNEMLARIFKAFENRLIKSIESISNWLRSISMILMYNITFLDSKTITPADVNTCVSEIYKYYFTEAVGHPQMQLYAIKTLIFLLKYRRTYNNFAKQESPYKSDVDTYYRYRQITEHPEYAVSNTAKRHLKMLKDFLDSKGSIDVPDMDD